MSHRVRAATQPPNPVVGYSREILAQDIVSHANYSDFVGGQLHQALQAVLGGQPRYQRLLDLLASADARVVRRLANNESGANYSAWLPGARDAYRRELTPGHHMMAVADELAKLSKEVASRAGQGWRGVGRSEKGMAPAQQLERQLLFLLAEFLHEMKRAVRGQAVPHVTAENSQEMARRIHERGRDGQAQPGHEETSTVGWNARAGGGIELSEQVKMTATGRFSGTEQRRVIIDFDRDANVFREKEYGVGLEVGAGFVGVLNAGGNLGLSRQRGKYYEHGDLSVALTVENLAANRKSSFFNRSASPGARSVGTLRHGLGTLARKLVGGGSDRPYDGASWAGGKEEKGRYNRTRLQELSVSMQAVIDQLAMERRVDRSPVDLGQAARECFPTMTQKIGKLHEAQRAADARGEVRQAPRLNIPDEPISVPAMQPRPGDPTKKRMYEGYTLSAGISASVGFHPLADRTGPDALSRALDKVKNFLPSGATSHGGSRNNRSLYLQRDLPVHEVLGPALVLDGVKGIAHIDNTVLEMSARLPQSKGAHGKRPAVAPVAPVHPAFATLRRYENTAYAQACLRQGVSTPYLATTKRFIEEGRLSAPDLIRDLERRLADFEVMYSAMITHCHDAKEAFNGCQPMRHLPKPLAAQMRQASAARLAASVAELNATHWNGWYAVDRQPEEDKLVRFIGHTVAQASLALARLKYELTFAKQALGQIGAQGAAFPARERDDLRRLCAALDARVVELDATLRDQRAPLTMDQRTGLNFFSLDSESRRKLKTWTSGFNLTLGLPAAVTAAIGNGAVLSSLRGPEVRVTTTQSFNHVERHPNLNREGQFYTLALVVAAGAGTRSLIGAAEKAVRKAQKSGHLPAAFAESIREQLADNLRHVIDARGDTLAAVTRSSGLQLEISYGSPPSRSGETPRAHLRYTKVMQVTTHDNSVRAPNVLAATGLPVTFSPGFSDVTNRTSVLLTRHGNSLRHLVLEFSGYRGLKDYLKGDAATGALDFEATRQALLAPLGAPIMEGWCHRQTPLVDVVGKYLAHVRRAPGDGADPADELDYMDIGSKTAQRLEETEPALRFFAAGSGQDPFEPRLAETSRQRLARLSRDWRDDGRLEALRRHMAALPCDEARVDFLTRDPRGQELLSQAAAVLDAYSTWSSMTRTVIGYGGTPNHASIDKLKLREPAAARDQRWADAA